LREKKPQKNVVQYLQEQVWFSRRRTPGKYIAQYSQEQGGISRRMNIQSYVVQYLQEQVWFGFFQVFTRTSTIFQESIQLFCKVALLDAFGVSRKNYIFEVILP